MERDMNWVLNIFLIPEARPEMLPPENKGIGVAGVSEIAFFKNSGYPAISFFAADDKQRRWAAAMAAASAEFWQREDAAELKTARAA